METYTTRQCMAQRIVQNVQDSPALKLCVLMPGNRRKKNAFF